MWYACSGREFHYTLILFTPSNNIVCLYSNPIWPTYYLRFAMLFWLILTFDFEIINYQCVNAIYWQWELNKRFLLKNMATISMYMGRRSIFLNRYFTSWWAHECQNDKFSEINVIFFLIISKFVIFILCQLSLQERNSWIQCDPVTFS